MNKTDNGARYMNFGQYLRILYPYLRVEGEDKITKGKFISHLFTIIMNPPEYKEETEMADELNEYYPECKDSMSRKILDGTAFLSKDKADEVRKNYFHGNIRHIIYKLSKYEKKNIISKLEDYQIQCTIDTVPAVCDEMMRLFIKNIAEDYREIDVSNIGRNKPNYEDMLFLEETHFVCPKCGIRLRNRDTGIYRYKIVTINNELPASMLEDDGNQIALCPNCAIKYELNITDEDRVELEDIKIFMLNNNWADDIISYDKMVEGVESLLKKISKTNPEYHKDNENMDTTTIKNKHDGTNFPLFNLIEYQVATYFKEVEFIIEMKSTISPANYDILCSQIHDRYLKLHGGEVLTQGEIYDKLTDWLYNMKKADRNCCTILVSYFVQKCEVFDDLSK